MAVHNPRDSDFHGMTPKERRAKLNADVAAFVKKKGKKAIKRVANGGNAAAGRPYSPVGDRSLD